MSRRYNKHPESRIRIYLEKVYPKKHAIRAYFGYLRHPWTIYYKNTCNFFTINIVDLCVSINP